jgi:predicted RNase H-like nuclease (RuvC/YqgF family)
VKVRLELESARKENAKFLSTIEACEALKMEVPKLRRKLHTAEGRVKELTRKLSQYRSDVCEMHRDEGRRVKLVQMELNASMDTVFSYLGIDPKLLSVSALTVPDEAWRHVHAIEVYSASA